MAREYSFERESGQGASDETTCECELDCSAGDVDVGWSCGSSASGGASGGWAAQRSGSGTAGHVAGSESRERVRESGGGAIREEHDGSGGSDAGREIQLQAFAGDEFVRAP